MLHRLSYILLICFLAGSASGQYPATGNKSRLGWQTTADGLVWRGAIGDTATIDPVGLLQAWALVDTASGVLYQYRGKAWRPVLAYAIQPFDSVVFNNNEGDADSAELKYNADIGSLVYGANDGAQIPVLPGHWFVRNDTSVTLTKGTLVRAVGTIGASGRIKVRHMIGDNSISAEYVMGIVVKDIPAGEDGYIMFYGKIRKLNTNAFNEGDLLYPDDFTPGALTNAPVYFKTPIAFVVHKSINQGVIAVRIQTENYLSRLHDVTLPGLAAQNILRYSGEYWIPGRDTSIYDFDARLKGNRTVLMNNFDIKFRNQVSSSEYVQIRPSFVMVTDSATGEQATLNKYGIAGPVTGGYLSEVRLANGVYLNGSNSRFIEGLDTGDGYDVTIDTVGRVRFRVSAAGAADSLYGKTSSGLLTAIKPNYLAYTDTASMLSTYLRPSEILAGTGITLVKDSTVTISAPTTLSSSTAIIDVAEVFVDGLSTLRLPWDGTAVVGIIKTGLYLTSGVNEAFVQHELIPNGDKGDITTSAGGAVMTINTGTVSLTKLSSGVRDTLALKLNAADTASLSNRINLKLNIADTASMLTNYVNFIDTGSIIATKTNLALKLNISDTASMLLRYVNFADTLAMLSTYLKAKDTTSLSNRINLKLNIADTASMLTNYINAVDTASMLLPYLRKADTLAMLSTYVNFADTASMLLTYINRADTAAMLDSYINRADTASMLTNYINAVDTAAMLSQYVNFADTVSIIATKKDVVITDNAVRDRERHYVHLTPFRLKDTVTNNFENSDFFVVPSDLQAWCIRTMQARAGAGGGTVDLELIVDGVTKATLSGITISGASLTPTNISIASNNIVTLKSTGLSGTVVGLTATIQIQKTCN